MRNKIKLLLVLALTFSMLISCGIGKSNKNSTDKNTQASVETQTQDKNNDDAESTDNSEDNLADHSFYELKAGETKQEVLKKDNKTVSITLNLETSKKNNADFYSVSVDDETLDIISDSNVSTYQTAKCYFAHKNQNDYIITSLEGKDDKRITYVYRLDGSSLNKVFEIEDNIFYDITDDCLLVTSQKDCFGTWEVVDDFVFYGRDDDSFDVVAGMNKSQVITNPQPLTLKQNVIFSMDDSGVEPKELKAGDKIYPSFYEPHGWMGFEDEDGNSLGEVSVKEVKENGHKVYYAGLSYDKKNNRYDANYDSENSDEDWISEADLFEENYYSHER